ncbi:hypothetical protein PM082_020223 [Marasmius tenuissimus]|nr:hypothetical protein PM082_020223 [Marasmius tenuissimus]
MNTPVKSKRKTLHTDPYAGGEKSGKKAKKDARSALSTVSDPLTVPAPIPPSIHPPHIQFNSLAAQIPMPVFRLFNPETFNLRDRVTLAALKRQDLNILC